MSLLEQASHLFAWKWRSLIREYKAPRGRSLMSSEMKLKSDLWLEANQMNQAVKSEFT